MYLEDFVGWGGGFCLMLIHVICVHLSEGDPSAMRAAYVTWWVSQHRRSHMAAHPSFAFQLYTALAIRLCN